MCDDLMTGERSLCVMIHRTLNPYNPLRKQSTPRRHMVVLMLI